jgi:hypothetical protein
MRQIELDMRQNGMNLTESAEFSLPSGSLNEAFKSKVDSAIAAIRAIESAVKAAANLAMDIENPEQHDVRPVQDLIAHRRAKPPFQLRYVAEREISLKKLRATYFPDEVLEDAGWNILIDLFLQQQLDRDVSITSSCLASGVPPTTALRWIDVLEGEGMIVREDDASDKRRRFVRLTDRAYNAMAEYLSMVALSRYRVRAQDSDFD